MRSLLGVEFRRLGSRRLFRLLMLALFLTVATILVVNGVRSNNNLAGARAAAAAQAKALDTPPPGLVAQCGASLQVIAPPQGNGPVRIGPCTFVAPSAADLYQDPRFSFALNAVNLVTAGIAIVAILGFVVGAGFIGAEWTAGTFPLLLTWEPRRLRVLLAKLVAVIVAFVLIAVVTVAVFLAGAWVIAATRGTTAGTNAAHQHALLMYSLRGLVLVALLTGAGAAVAGLTRHTSAALAGAIGYLVVFEFVVRRLHPEWARWLLTSNAGALLGGTASLDVVDRKRAFIISGKPPATFVLHADRAAVYLGVLFVVAVGAWSIALVRRDVDESGGR